MEMYREGKAQHSTAAWRTAAQHSRRTHSSTEGLGGAQQPHGGHGGAQDPAGREISWIQINGKEK